MAQPGEWASAYLAQRGLRGLAAGLAPAGWARLVPTLRRRDLTEPVGPFETRGERLRGARLNSATSG